MANTPNLNLPYIAAAQAQKHVTHNEALRALDAVVQLAVLDKDLTAPPLNPNEGDRYIIAAPASSQWAGSENQIAAWQDGAWAFYPPQQGWLAWIGDEAQLYGWDGTQWVMAGGAVNPTPLVGINSTADVANRLSLSSAASLFNHEGSDHQIKINKNAVTDTASLLFQTGFSGRAEFGLTGDDDWHVKTSADGNSWQEALIADGASGTLRFPNGIEHAASRTPIAQFLFTEGGDGVVSFYRNDSARTQNPRSYIISTINGNVITLTTTNATTIFKDSHMNGVSYVRIWNMSKTPAQSAWVKAQPANNQITVLDSATIAGWTNGETIQLGDPVSITPNRVIAIDISPMLQNVFGNVFRQKGLVCKSGLAPETGISMGLGITPTGLGGSFVGFNSPKDGSFAGSLLLVPCSQLSPVSNSNLIFVREGDGGGTLTTTLLSAMAVFG